MVADDFLLRMIEAGHTAIFQWIAVYVASGIGTLQIIIEALRSNKKLLLHRIVYGVIAFILILAMTISIYQIFYVMHAQNTWANQLSDINERNIFYESRSVFSSLIVGRGKISPLLSTDWFRWICYHLVE